MPRFYFDYENGGTAIDSDGQDLPTLHAAKAEALAALGDAARDFTRGASEGRLCIRVRDGDGPVLELSATFEIKLVKS